jgi:hypothetical protein
MTLFKVARIVCGVLALMYLGAAATIVLVALPAPAAGGTCGPSSSSESALEAFFNPGSIGAGREPSVSSGQRPQWQAFVNECQSSTTTRVGTAGAILVGALLLGLGVPWVVRRFTRDEALGHGGLPPSGWYPDPTDPASTRWWDGTAWGPHHTPPEPSATPSFR